MPRSTPKERAKTIMHSGAGCIGCIGTLAWNANRLLSKHHVMEEGEEVATNSTLLVVVRRNCIQTHMPQASDVFMFRNPPDCGAARV